MTYKQRLATPIIWAANHLGMLDVYSSLRGRLVGLQVPILLYHRVGGAKYPWIHPSITPRDFEHQLIYLCQRYEVLSLDKIGRYIQERKPLPQKAAVVSFDDGYKDNYTCAYPILKKYNVPATIFLATGYIGSGNLFWTDKVRYIVLNTTLKTLELNGLAEYPLRSTGERLRAASRIVESLKNLPGEEKDSLIEKLVNISGVAIPANLGKELILSWDEVKEMSNNGIAFGAHTVTHPILTKLPLEEARREIIQSKQHIEQKLNQAVTTFCYPGGEPTDFNDDIKQIVKENGFACAVTVAPRMVTTGTDLYELGRISAQPNFNTFKLFLSGLLPDLSAILSRIRG